MTFYFELSLDVCFFFFSSRRRHTRLQGDWSSDVCSSDLFNTLLLVHVTALEPAQQAAQSVLDQHAKRWELREILPAGDGRSTLEYLVRLAKDTPPGPLLDQMKTRGAPHVIAAEYRSLRGLRNE